MTALVKTAAAALIALTVASAGAQTPRYALLGGRWFDGHRFVDTTFYTEHGLFTTRRPATVDSVIELGGAFVIPRSARRTRTT